MALRKAWTHPARQSALLVALAALYLAGVAFGDLAARAADGLPTVWPCNALLAAGLLHLTPRRRLVLLGLAAVIGLVGGVLTGDPWPLSLVRTVLDLAEAGLAAALIERAFGAAPRLRDLRRAVQVVALAVPVSLAAAALGAGASHLLLGQALVPIFVDWAVTGVLGMVVILPAMLILLDPDSARQFQQPARTQLACYMLVAITTLLAFSNDQSPVPFLIFPAALLAAFQLGPRGAAVAALIAGAIAAPLTLAGLGPTTVIPNWEGPSRVRLVQVFVATLLFTALATAMALTKLLRLKRLMGRQHRAAHRARIRAQAADRLKGELLATLGQQIRTPLNSLLGVTQLLEARPDLPPEARRQLEQMAEAGDALRAVVDDVLEASWVEADGAAPAPRDPVVAPETPAPTDAPPPRVLLVDDHPMNRQIGAAFLALAGCEVVCVDSGVAAVSAAADGGFDLILMDIHMPGLDGLAATRAIRALDGAPGAVPIIAMSADALPDQVALCLAAGMVDHVAKPIQREVLYAAVDRALAGGRGEGG